MSLSNGPFEQPFASTDSKAGVFRHKSKLFITPSLSSSNCELPQPLAFTDSKAGVFGHKSRLFWTPSLSSSNWPFEQPLAFTDSKAGVFGHKSTLSKTPSPSVSLIISTPQISIVQLSIVPISAGPSSTAFKVQLPVDSSLLRLDRLPWGINNPVYGAIDELIEFIAASSKTVFV